MNAPRSGVLVVAAALAAALMAHPTGTAEAAGAVPDLVSPDRGSETRSALEEGTLRSRTIEVNPGILDRSRAGNDRIRIELFDDVVVEAQVERFTGRSDGAFTWMGTVEGAPGSRVVLLGSGSDLTGSILIGSRAFEIRRGTEGHSVVEVARDPAPASRVIRTGSAYLGDAEERAGGGPTVIDVTIAYTERARTGAGGKQAVEALAVLAVESMNETLRASGVGVLFRLVKTGEIEFWETWDVLQDLEDLAYTGEAWQLKSWRNEFGSDLAMLFTGRDYGTAAELPGHYSIVGIGGDDGFSGISRVVELAVRAWGHNLGAGDADGCGLYADACPQDRPKGLFHTIMSDGSGCPGCVPAPLFSNPDIEFSWLEAPFVGTDLYYGPPALQPKETGPLPAGRAGRADNAGAISRFAPTAAAWRDTVVRGPTCGGLPATWVGSQDDDTFFGTAGRDVVVARKGDDTVRGGGGSDVLCGGPGRDDVSGGDGDDFVYGNGGNDLLRGMSGHDILDGAGSRDRLFGGIGDDVLRGGKADDVLYGGAGDDSLSGASGKDRLFGNDGDDRLVGGGGQDHLEGGPGTDWLQPDPGDQYHLE